MDTTDFMQKLSQHAQQTGELMEEAVRQMEMLQAETEHYKKYAPGNEWYISVKEHNRIVSRLKAQLEQAKQALAMMWFAYENKNTDCPHGFEAEAVQAAQGILGTWKECMPKYLGRGAKEG